jgi:hemoglobin
LLYENQYSGNPMMVHGGISAIKPQHFDIWLGLFEQTLFSVLEHEPALL